MEHELEDMSGSNSLSTEPAQLQKVALSRPQNWTMCQIAFEGQVKTKLCPAGLLLQPLNRMLFFFFTKVSRFDWNFADNCYQAATEWIHKPIIMIEYTANILQNSTAKQLTT